MSTNSYQTVVEISLEVKRQSPQRLSRDKRTQKRFLKIIYFSERDHMQACTSKGSGQAQAADSPLSGEPQAVLHPRALGS